MTPAQLSLAWLLAQGDDIVPIPRTKKRNFLEENIKAVGIKLSKEVLEDLNQLFPIGCAKGKKYPEAFELER